MVVPRLATLGSALALAAFSAASVAFPSAVAAQQPPARIADPADVEVPAGYELEVVAEGLSYATDVAFDDEGNVYVSEAGGHTYGTVPDKARRRAFCA